MLVKGCSERDNVSLHCGLGFFRTATADLPSTLLGNCSSILCAHRPPKAMSCDGLNSKERASELPFRICDNSQYFCASHNLLKSLFPIFLKGYNSHQSHRERGKGEQDEIYPNSLRLQTSWFCSAMKCWYGTDSPQLFCCWGRGALKSHVVPE